MTQHNVIKEKMREAVSSVLPIASIVAILCLFFVPIDNGLLLTPRVRGCRTEKTF